MWINITLTRGKMETWKKMQELLDFAGFNEYN